MGKSYTLWYAVYKKYHIKQKIHFYLIAPNPRKSWTMLVLRSPPWLGWPLWNFCVTNDHGYGLLVVNTSRSFPRSWLITGFLTRLTRRVQLVEQDHIPEWGSCYSIFSFMCMFCRLLFVLLYFFFWPLCCLFFFDIRILIAPFGIFRLFFKQSP